MAHQTVKWDISELSKAMANAIFEQANNRFLKHDGQLLKFNGFWRNGDKQNVCAWLNKATWADAKTGEGGGCKEFAKVAFNLTLPEFMERYGSISSLLTRAPRAIETKSSAKSANALAVHNADEIWHQLCQRDSSREDRAALWLQQERGFIDPRSSIGSGFANLYKEDLHLFAHHHRHLMEQRISLGPNLVAPIRSVNSAQVDNLFFRALDPVSKENKSRLLNGQGGWSSVDNSPRAFGYPHLIHDFPQLVLCEGMADYFAAECLLGCNDNYLAIGAANASALTNWAGWLSATRFRGKVIILYQIDKDQSGRLSSLGIGQSKASQTLKKLLENKISASLFKWPRFLKHVERSNQQPSDLADVCKIYGSKAISEQFMTTLSEVD